MSRENPAKLEWFMRHQSIIAIAALLLFGCTVTGFAQGGQLISAPYGPPTQANQWEKFTIPLTAETFGVTSEVFASVMADVQMFRIRTEMQDGPDVGGVDQVIIGDRFAANFDSGNDGWNAAGDGTLEWIAAGGIGDGYIQISDWASGDWHYAVAPLNWAGDWSSLIGQTLEFYFKTDQPAYASVVEISSIREKRLILATSSLNLSPGSTATMSVTLSEQTPTGLSISLNSSNPSCVEAPEAVVVASGENRAEFTIIIPETAEEGCSSVITTQAEGYGTSRLTIKVKPRYENAVLNGRVTDATTGLGIAAATVSIAGISTTTNADGGYELTDIPTNQISANFNADPRSGDTPLTVQFTDLSGSSFRTLTVSSPGYITYESPVLLNPGQTLSMNISLSPIITDNEFRIVLNWSETPADLDIYLLVPGFEDNASQYVYYSNRGWFNQYPWAMLDIDRRQGYGPETITIQQLIPDKYVFFVHNYSREVELTASAGVVQIYGKAGLLQTVTVPLAGEGNYWYIGDIDGATSQVTIKNVIVSEQPRLPGAGVGLAKPAAKIQNRLDITSWSWDFDDDGVVDATSQNPVYTYTTPGSYTVALTVSDGDNTYTERKENYITVTSPTPDLSGFSVSITNIDISNFPLVKCFVSVIDDALSRPASDLISTNFDVKEEAAEVTSLSVRHLDSSSGARADIVYVFDTTGSMGSEIETLKNRALAFADSLEISGIDYRLGLVTYGDEILSMHDFTADASEFKTWIEGLIADGGGDTKENTLEGLAAATRLSYREMTQKVAILITDADYHEAGETGDGTSSYTTDSIISLMNDQTAQVNVVGPSLSQYERMAKDTGGQYYNIDSDFTDIIRRIGDWITSQYVVNYVPENDIADNTLRHVNIKVISGDKGGSNTGAYFIGSARLVLNPPSILGRNGEAFTVDVRVENVTDLSMGQWTISFDNTKVQGLSVTEGDFFSKDSVATTFLSEISNSTGLVEINASRMAGAADSASVSGSGLLARISLKVLTDDCTSQLSFQTPDFRRPDSSVVTLITAGAQIRPIGTVGASELSCDFDEDLDIDTRDFALLATYWNRTDAPIGDVGPATGAVPMLTPQPDGKVNHEDLFVFTRMWNWYHGAVDASGGGLGKTSGAAYAWQEQQTSDGAKRMTLAIENIEKLAMGHFIFNYNADAFELQSAREGTLLTADGSSAAMLVEEKLRGQIDVTLSRLTALGKPTEVFGNGALLVLDFHQKSDGALGLYTENIDLRTARNQPVYIKTIIEENGSPSVQAPLVYSLLNHPNPFNSRTVIEFTLPQAAEVKIDIINILGQPVRSLISKKIEAGSHKVTWDGIDNSDAAVGTGMYLIRLQTDDRQMTRKILYLK
jgi:PKD repeat protein